MFDFVVVHNGTKLRTGGVRDDDVGHCHWLMAL